MKDLSRRKATCRLDLTPENWSRKSWTLGAMMALERLPEVSVLKLSTDALYAYIPLASEIKREAVAEKFVRPIRRDLSTLIMVHDHRDGLFGGSDGNLGLVIDGHDGHDLTPEGWRGRWLEMMIAVGMVSSAVTGMETASVEMSPQKLIACEGMNDRYTSWPSRMDELRRSAKAAVDLARERNTLAAHFEQILTEVRGDFCLGFIMPGQTWRRVAAAPGAPDGPSPWKKDATITIEQVKIAGFDTVVRGRAVADKYQCGLGVFLEQWRRDTAGEMLAIAEKAAGTAADDRTPWDRALEELVGSFCELAESGSLGEDHNHPNRGSAHCVLCAARLARAKLKTHESSLAAAVLVDLVQHARDGRFGSWLVSCDTACDCTVCAAEAFLLRDGSLPESVLGTTPSVGRKLEDVIRKRPTIRLRKLMPDLAAWAECHLLPGGKHAAESLRRAAPHEVVAVMTTIIHEAQRRGLVGCAPDCWCARCFVEASLKFYEVSKNGRDSPEELLACWCVLHARGVFSGAAFSRTFVTDRRFDQAIADACDPGVSVVQGLHRIAHTAKRSSNRDFFCREGEKCGDCLACETLELVEASERSLDNEIKTDPLLELSSEWLAAASEHEILRSMVLCHRDLPTSPGFCRCSLCKVDELLRDEYSLLNAPSLLADVAVRVRKNHHLAGSWIAEKKIACRAGSAWHENQYAPCGVCLTCRSEVAAIMAGEAGWSLDGMLWNVSDVFPDDTSVILRRVVEGEDPSAAEGQKLWVWRLLRFGFRRSKP